MKHATPLLIAGSLTMMLWTACASGPGPTEIGGKCTIARSYATKDDPQDTTKFHKPATADTLLPTTPPPARPDSTNKIPPR